MALFLFTKKILAGQPIQLFNNGEHVRDFTYVDDIADGIVRVSDRIAVPDPGWNSEVPDPASSNAPFRILNIGSSAPVHLNDYIAAIEAAVGKKAIRELMPLQPGDVPHTFAEPLPT
jgi:UDP-glucuronate 4-epimerase